MTDGERLWPLVVALALAFLVPLSPSLWSWQSESIERLSSYAGTEFAGEEGRRSSERLDFSMKSLGDLYVVDILEPSSGNPALVKGGEDLTVAFSFSKGNEPVNHELADISATYLSVGERQCLVPTGPFEPFAEDVSALPAIYDGGAATVRGKGYLIGGIESEEYFRSILEYDPVTRTTTAVFTLQVGLRFASVAALNDEIYILGGKENGVVSAAIRSYDPMQNTLQEVGELPETRFWGAAAVAGDMIYYGGGFDGVGNPGSVSDSIFRFDPATGESVQVSTLPNPTTILAATTAYGKVYFIGGNVGAAPGGPNSNAIVEYDPETNLALQVATYPGEGLEGQTATTLSGKVYIFNGSPYKPDARNDVFMFDPRSMENAVRVGHVPHRTERGALVDIYGRGYLFGGLSSVEPPVRTITSFTPPDATARFNLSSLQWEATCSIPEGPGRALDLFTRVRYINHATGQSFVAADGEDSAVLIRSHDERLPPHLCAQPPSVPRADGIQDDRRGVATWVSGRGSVELAPRPYCLKG